jgi:hypothetical protein
MSSLLRNACTEIQTIREPRSPQKVYSTVIEAITFVLYKFSDTQKHARAYSHRYRG